MCGTTCLHKGLLAFVPPKLAETWKAGSLYQDLYGFSGAKSSCCAGIISQAFHLYIYLLLLLQHLPTINFQEKKEKTKTKLGEELISSISGILLLLFQLFQCVQLVLSQKVLS